MVFIEIGGKVMKNEGMYYPMSHAQKRVWVSEMMNTQEREEVCHAIGGYLTFPDGCEVQWVIEAIQSMVNLQESFRIQIGIVEDQPYQYENMSMSVQYEIVDITGIADEGIHEQILKNTNRVIFNYDQPLYLFSLFVTEETCKALQIEMSHIIADGWSFNVLRDILIDQIYCRQQNILSEMLPKSYLETVATEEKYKVSSRFQRDQTFWSDYLKEPLNSYGFTSNQLTSKRVVRKLSLELSQSIQKSAKSHGVGINSIYTAGISLWLHHFMDVDNATFTLPVYNRKNRNERMTVGMFTSTVPYLIKINHEETIKEFVSRTNTNLMQCFLHQRYPFDLLGTILKDHNINAAWNEISINYYNSDFVSKTAEGEFKLFEIPPLSQPYGLQIVLKESDTNDQFELAVDYHINRWEEVDILYLVKVMAVTLELLVTNEDSTLKAVIEKMKAFESSFMDHLSTAPLAQQESALAAPKKSEWDNVVSWIERTAKNNSSRIAIQEGKTQISYDQLQALINQGARYIESLGLEKHSKIGLLMPHSIEVVIAILSILKTGHSYVPLDVSHPSERHEMILEAAKVGCVLIVDDTEQVFASKIKGVSFNLASIEAYSQEGYVNAEAADCLAYTIYTSGSTGVPKGVEINHSSLLQYIIWASEVYVPQYESFAFFTSLAFDLTVTSIFAPLLAGGSIIVYRDNEAEYVLYRVLNDNLANVIKVTPTHLRLLLSHPMTNTSLQRVIVGGENLMSEVCEGLIIALNRKVEIINEYGPTEATVGCMIQKYNANQSYTNQSVPIGMPAPGVELMVLDADMRRQSLCKIGELFIGGAFVARGYAENEQLTQDVFISNPYKPNERLYKTGDLVRLLGDGNLVYMGRKDHQVKINGVRIELGEIESCVMSHSGVTAAVAVAFKTVDHFSKIGLFVIANEELTTASIMKYCRNKLPYAVVPSRIHLVTRMPETPNGKTDILSIQRYFETNEDLCSHDYSKLLASSTTTMEEILITRFCTELIGSESIDIDSHFLEIGGDSIKAIQLASKLLTQGYQVSVKDILSSDSLRMLINSLKKVEKTTNMNQGPYEGEMLHSPIIDWFFKQNLVKPFEWNQSILLSIPNQFEAKSIRNALIALVKVHDVLRVKVDFNNEYLWIQNQQIANTLELNQVMLTDELILGSHAFIERCVQVKTSFSEDSKLLVKGVLFTNPGGYQYLFLTAHHLIVDAFSWHTMIEDFISLIQQSADDSSVQQLQFGTTWNDYIHFNKWQEKMTAFPHQVYWDKIIEQSKGTLSNVSQILSFKVIIDQSVSAQLLVDTCQRLKCTPEDLIATVIASAYCKQAGIDQQIIELERPGRYADNVKCNVQRTVGWFTQFIPVLSPKYQENLVESVRLMKDEIRSIEATGLEYMSYIMSRSIEPSHQTEKIRINFLGSMTAMKFGDFSLISVDHGPEKSAENTLDCKMEIDAHIETGQIVLKATYNTGVFNLAWIDDFKRTLIACFDDLLTESKQLESVVYSSSDFTASDISLEDLDFLIG